MLFSDVSLSRRLERAEGHACLQFAEARRRVFPGSGSEWIECAGAYAVFDGIDSPTPQSFGLGLFEELTPSTLDTIERAGFDVFHAEFKLSLARQLRQLPLAWRLAKRQADDSIVE